MHIQRYITCVVLVRHKPNETITKISVYLQIPLWSGFAALLNLRTKTENQLFHLKLDAYNIKALWAVKLDIAFHDVHITAYICRHCRVDQNGWLDLMHWLNSHTRCQGEVGH